MLPQKKRDPSTPQWKNAEAIPPPAPTPLPQLPARGTEAENKHRALQLWK